MTFVSPYIAKNTVHKSNEKFGLTPLIEGIQEMQLISTNKRIRDDFDLVSVKKTDDDLALQLMMKEYEKVAMQLEEQFDHIDNIDDIEAKEESL